MDGGHVVDSENWVFSGIAMRGCHLKPVLTKVPLEVKEGEGEGEGDHGSNYTATTPTSSESRIPKILICPPAPKKRKSTSSASSSTSSSSKLCHYGRVREFFNPPDLEAVFVRRVEGA